MAAPRTELCTTPLNYFPRSGMEASVVEVSIGDGRAAALPGWDECGFELLAHDAAVRDWGDDAQVAAAHHPEMEALAKEMTGCDVALVPSHIKRNVDEASRHHDLGPITLVHSDFADSYGDLIRDRYRHAEAGGEFEVSLRRAGLSGEAVVEAKRLVILQFWRNVGPPKMDLPLAWCDCRTVPREEIRPFPVTNYAGGGFDFEALGFAAPADPADHAWFGFDELQVGEVVAFRTYDSARVESGEAYWTPHSAYRDPAVALGSPSRSSIELRATCLYF